MSTTRYAIRIDRVANTPSRQPVTSWIFRLDRYTTPAWTQDSHAALTWASKHSARKQAERYHIADYTIEPLDRKA